MTEVICIYNELAFTNTNYYLLVFSKESNVKKYCMDNHINFCKEYLNQTLTVDMTQVIDNKIHILLTNDIQGICNQTVLYGTDVDSILDNIITQQTKIPSFENDGTFMDTEMTVSRVDLIDGSSVHSILYKKVINNNGENLVHLFDDDYYTLITNVPIITYLYSGFY
jgi:hypothetical protein